MLSLLHSTFFAVYLYIFPLRFKLQLAKIAFCLELCSPAVVVVAVASVVVIIVLVACILIHFFWLFACFHLENYMAALL